VMHASENRAAAGKVNQAERELASGNPEGAEKLAQELWPLRKIRGGLTLSWRASRSSAVTCRARRRISKRHWLPLVSPG
jgi:hypothetical protein